MTDAETPTGRQILDTPMQPNDADATTIRGYLIALLAAIWKGRDSKRPFGSSGWDFDPIAALVRAGHITGTFDDDGYLDEADSEKGRELIASAIQALAGEDT